MGIGKNQGGMDFRDLVSFNWAMLAKQLWRIIIRPHSLVATILKEKHFKHKDVLETQPTKEECIFYVEKYPYYSLYMGPDGKWEMVKK